MAKLRQFVSTPFCNRHCSFAVRHLATSGASAAATAAASIIRRAGIVRTSRIVAVGRVLRVLHVSLVA